jgi:hypothetical protein
MLTTTARDSSGVENALLLGRDLLAQSLLDSGIRLRSSLCGHSSDLSIVR